MARVYTVSKGGLTVIGANTMVFLNPLTTGSTIEVLRLWLSQSGTAVSEQQSLQIHTQVTTFPTVVSVTPSKAAINDPASEITGATTGANGTCGVNASAEGGGTQTVLWADTFSNLNGWVWVATPRETLLLNSKTLAGVGLKLTSTPTTKTGWAVGMTYAELG